MTNRVKGFVVTLDTDYREDDAEAIKNALLQIKGVIGVSSSVTDVHDHMNRQMMKQDLLSRILETINDYE